MSPPDTDRIDPRPRIGTAGWAVPKASAERFAAVGTHLARYARRFSAVEINSSFYRPHRRTTYERWAASVPEDFRFCVKLPKTITHERRLENCDELVQRFAEEIGGLGGKRGPVLVQLPPSFAFPGPEVERFFAALRTHVGTDVVLEPRHASWLTSDVDQMLDRQRVARVAADPARSPAAAVPGGWAGLAYLRMHGSPQIYVSSYPPDAIAGHAALIRSLQARGTSVWWIYDNTADGAATRNAFDLSDRLA